PSAAARVGQEPPASPAGARRPDREPRPPRPPEARPHRRAPAPRSRHPHRGSASAVAAGRTGARSARSRGGRRRGRCRPLRPPPSIRGMTTRRFPKRPSLESMVERVDQQRPGDVPGDTVPTGFQSIDRILGGGLRRRDLVVLDYLQLVPSPRGVARSTQDEDLALVLQRLKALALERRVALVVVSQLPRFDAKRPNARPALDDFGHLGAIKQHADVVLGIYREEMYNPGHGVDGATELIVLKNRNGPTGFVDLYFYRRWMR